MNFFWRFFPLGLMVAMTLLGGFLIKKQVDALYNSFKVKATQKEMYNMAQALKAFYIEHDRLPACNKETGRCDEAVEAITKFLESKKKNPLLDLWGSFYGYQPIMNGQREEGFELRSAGPDKKMNTNDDVVWTAKL